MRCSHNFLRNLLHKCPHRTGLSMSVLDALLDKCNVHSQNHTSSQIDRCIGGDNSDHSSHLGKILRNKMHANQVRINKHRTHDRIALCLNSDKLLRSQRHIFLRCILSNRINKKLFQQINYHLIRWTQGSISNNIIQHW